MLEKRLSDALRELLNDNIPTLISALGEPQTPWNQDQKVVLPGLFIKITAGEEAIRNTTIAECEVEIELRYVIKNADPAAMLAHWTSISELFRQHTMDSIADTLTGYDPNLHVHYVEISDGEPTARDGERHFTLNLEIGCAQL